MGIFYFTSESKCLCAFESNMDLKVTSYCRLPIYYLRNILNYKISLLTCLKAKLFHLNMATLNSLNSVYENNMHYIEN